MALFGSHGAYLMPRLLQHWAGVLGSGEETVAACIYAWLVTLEGQLDEPRSQLRGFFDEYLSNTKALWSLVGGALGGVLAVTPPDVPDPYPFGEVGGTFGVSYSALVCR